MLKKASLSKVTPGDFEPNRFQTDPDFQTETPGASLKVSRHTSNQEADVPQELDRNYNPHDTLGRRCRNQFKTID